MDSVALTIAVITYAGVALGGIPGIALDRTGIALLGAIGMVLTLLSAKVLSGTALSFHRFWNIIS